MTTKIYYVLKVTECGRQGRSDMVFFVNQGCALRKFATSAFHCILSRSLNEAAYNTYSAGVMEIRIEGSSCRRPQLLFNNFLFSHTRSDPRFFIFETTTSRLVLEDFLFVQPN